MQRIGFIDYFIDEWHANNYPTWIRDAGSDSGFEVALAWEETANPEGRDLAQWCRDMGIAQAASLEQVVAECDALCVLAPRNPEVHERLADLPLRSGKPVYIDKTFAPDRPAARRMFALAERYGTPLMSCSALRFGTELQQACRETFAGQRPIFVNTGGGGRSFAEYAVHQVEMITALMGTGARRVMQCGNTLAQHMTIDYADERRAALSLLPGLDFQVCAANRERTVAIPELTDFFPNLIAAMLAFFMSGESPVDARETIEIAALVRAGLDALETPGIWVDIPD